MTIASHTDRVAGRFFVKPWVAGITTRASALFNVPAQQRNISPDSRSLEGFSSPYVKLVGSRDAQRLLAGPTLGILSSPDQWLAHLSRYVVRAAGTKA